MRRTKPAASILLAVAPLLASCATAGATGGATAGASSVTFHVRPPKVNDTAESNETFTSKVEMTISAGVKTIETETVENVRRRRYTTTVVAMRGDVVTAERIHFLSSTQENTVGERQGPPSIDPVTGKTYLARFVNGKVEISTGDGAAVPDAEAKLVHQQVEDLGKANPMGAFLAAHRFAKGVEMKVPSKLVRRLFHMDPTDEVGPGGMTVVLSEVRSGKNGPLAVLATALTLSGSVAPKSRLTAHIKGSFVVEVDTGHVISANFSGPVEMTGQVDQGGAVYEMKATGTMSGTGTDVYR